MGIERVDPTVDTWTYYFADSANYNSDTTMRLYSHWAAFPIAKFPGIPNGTIISAYLKIYYAKENEGAGWLTEATISSLITDWTSATVTWASGKPTAGDDYGTINLTADGWRTSTDITTLIEYWQGNDNYGLQVRGNESNDATGEIDTLEGTNPWYLEIEVPSTTGFSGFQPWIFMKDMRDKNKKFWTPKILTPKYV